MDFYVLNNLVFALFNKIITFRHKSTQNIQSPKKSKKKNHDNQT